MEIVMMHWMSKAKERDVNKSVDEKLDNYDLYKREREDLKVKWSMLYR